jgi:hypothetical protein
VARNLLMLATVILGSKCALAEPQTLEVLGTARVNNRIETMYFRIAPHQAHVSELYVRSGSLAVTLVGVEVEYADGGLARFKLQDPLPPGQQSRPIPIDRMRTVKKVFLAKQPGLRPGETAIQLLGKIVK